MWLYIFNVIEWLESIKGSGYEWLFKSVQKVLTKCAIVMVFLWVWGFFDGVIKRAKIFKSGCMCNLFLQFSCFSWWLWGRGAYLLEIQSRLFVVLSKECDGIF